MSSSNSSNSNSSSEEEDELVLRPVHHRNRAPGKSSLKGSATGAAGGAAAAAGPKHVTHRTRTFVRSFPWYNEPGRIAYAGNAREPTAQGPREYPIDWEGIMNREEALKAAGAKYPGNIRGLLRKVQRRAWNRGEEINIHPTMTSAHIATKSLGREDPGFPTYTMPRNNSRASAMSLIRRMKQEAYNRSLESYQQGINKPPKLRMTNSNRMANLGNVQARWADPGTAAQLAQNLEGRHAPYTAAAQAAAAAVRTELETENEPPTPGGAASGASGGGEGGKRRRRTARRKNSKKTRRHPKK